MFRAFQRAREKKEKMLLKKKRGKDALEKSTTAWDLLMGGTLDENLEMRSDEDEPNDAGAETSSSAAMKQSQLVNVVDTNIPEETLQNASSLYLTLDVLAALLYISAVTIGCRWIMLSDILRWMREDRLGISVFQLAALCTGSLDKVKLGGNWKTKLILPLYEFQRTVLFVWQICRLPPVPAKIDFQQIVSRLLYHLNLPEVMMEHVSLLMKLAPPCVDLDETGLRRQGRVEQGSLIHGFSALEDGASPSSLLAAFGRPKHNSAYNMNTDIFFSTETKALAFILMALKLCFGLDDVREFQIFAVEEDAINKSFNFLEWYYNFVMRLMSWEGYDPLDILQTNKPVEPLLYEKYFSIRQVMSDTEVVADEGTCTHSIFTTAREVGFDHCVPPSMKIDSSTSIANPFPEDTYDVKAESHDDELLYVPLRYQTSVLREFLMRPRTAAEKQEIRSVVDERAVKIFKTDFTRSPLPCESPTIGIAHIPSDDPHARWYSYFPCAKGYVRYPRPQFTNGGIVYLKEDDILSFLSNRRMRLQKTCSGLRMLFASRKSAVDALEVAKEAMSHTFAKLLHCFSKIIGESESVLYAAFLMLEFQIADKKRLDNLKQSMIDGKVVPVQSTAVNRSGQRTFQTVYISSAEDVSDASEIDVVRLGLPRNWASTINSYSADVASEELDYTSESSYECDSESIDDSTGEV
ncbi:hypothetical protein GCK32_007218 [Trichostrongylus colubriformis]|uniref:Rrn7/TAF1B C-terminal cyclin domain-containing protein n=1 Tax=Trichostrongylus colubriformis TaxID=6319 RepID=A0AAN8FM98_TRICO